MVTNDGFYKLVRKSDAPDHKRKASKMFRTSSGWTNTFGASSDNNVEPMFRSGLGITIRKGHEPEIYRLSDPHSSSPIPSIFNNVDGVNLEIAPGRGFRISLHRC